MQSIDIEIVYWALKYFNINELSVVHNLHLFIVSASNFQLTCYIKFHTDEIQNIPVGLIIIIFYLKQFNFLVYDKLFCIMYKRKL